MTPNPILLAIHIIKKQRWPAKRYDDFFLAHAKGPQRTRKKHYLESYQNHEPESHRICPQSSIGVPITNLLFIDLSYDTNIRVPVSPELNFKHIETDYPVEVYDSLQNSATIPCCAQKCFMTTRVDLVGASKLVLLHCNFQGLNKHM
jgi:hypothetical protein